MSLITQRIFSNVNQYPSTWYWADRSWAAKTVSVAADRLKLVSPAAVQVDVGGLSMTQFSQSELDIALDAYWDFGQAITVHAVSTVYEVGAFVRPSTPNNYIYKCTTAGTTNSSAPTFGTSVGGTTADGAAVWTCYKDDTVAANRAGADYFKYVVWPNSGSTPKYVVSKNSTIPHGYTADNSRKIGGFHCLCLSAGTISGHPASGYLTGDIIPNSVWDLKFRSESGNNQGMAYDRDDGQWKFIYLASTDGGKAASVFGATIWDTLTWFSAVDACAAAGVRLMRDFEFQNGAIGSNEQTNIAGSADPVTTGAHSDTAGRRMISNKFLEDCCGALWSWLDEQSYRSDAATAHTHSVTVSGDAQTVSTGNASADVAPAWSYKAQTGGKGSLYTQGTYGSTKLVAGGCWNTAAYCGSRARDAGDFPWNAASAIGFRAVARSLTK